MTRLISLILAASFLGSCTASMAGPQPRNLRAENELREALGGKVAGRPVDCLPTYRSRHVQVIDDNTILFRDGRRTYLQAPRGGCAPLGSGHYTLVTQSFGGMGLCRGDIARVVDLQNGFTVGSCSFDDFVPFDRPGRS